MNLLLINSSIRSEESISRTLCQKLAAQLSIHEDTIIERDLTQGIKFISSDSMAAVSKPVDDRSAGQASNETALLADTLIQELQQADTIIIGAPIYNFGPPASLKAWADLVARAGTTFRYTEGGPEGLLKGKKAFIVAVSGGTPIDSHMDFMLPWLTFFLGFIGIADVEVITADGIFGQGGEEKIRGAHKTIESLTL